MPITPSIKNAIATFVGAINGVTNQNVIRSVGNKYELYVYSVVHNAIPIQLTPRGITNGKFRFRCSPGFINNSFSYFDFQGNNGFYELRNGIRVLGGSAADHEIDISIFKFSANNVIKKYPEGSDLKIAMECKCFSDSSTLKGEARKTIAAKIDLSEITVTINSQRGSTFFTQCNFDTYFITNLSVSSASQIATLLSYFDITSGFDFAPGSGSESAVQQQIRFMSW